MVGSGRAEVISSKGCSRLFSDINFTSSFRDLQSPHASMSPASSSTTSNSPFYGLVICVTGLSKEARKQVMDATKRLGGQYSPHLHPRCTHLVVESSHGRKFEYALKHGAAEGVFIVKLGWFVDSVRRNVRLNESLYVVKSFGENYLTKDDLNKNSCLGVAMLENAKESNSIERSRFRSSGEPKTRRGSLSLGQSSHEENQRTAILAKKGVRNRRMKGVKPLAQSILLGSICWSISEPSSTASIYMDSFRFDVAMTTVFVNGNENMKEPESSFVNFSRPLSESEKNELVLENHFVTILFPVDRFAEMGPCSRTFFSDAGFTRLQLLDYIYAFYQEKMSISEIELAIHTDSRHADGLRATYSSKETGYVELKRVEFIGNRKSFEMLKRVTGDYNNNVYELLVGVRRERV